MEYATTQAINFILIWMFMILLKIIVGLNIFVKEVNEFIGYHDNEAVIYGYICKKPVYRTTHSGREICDLIIASNRTSGRSDYIPTIAWGRTAERLSLLDAGTGIEVHGRMQSRTYTKVLDDGSSIEKTTYELSVL